MTAFLILAFSVTWMLADLPLILARNGLGILPFSLPSDWVMLPGTALGMAGAAFYVTSVVDGKAGVRKLFSQYTKWRIHPGWYLLALFQAFLLILASILVGAGSANSLLRNARLLITEFIPVTFAILLFGQLWEEVGWRGFILPRLQPRYGALTASLLLAGMQTLWHIPGFFFAGGITPPGEKLVISGPYLVGALIQTLAASLILGILATWMYNATKGSLFLIILFHTFSNASARLAILHITNSLVQAGVSGIAAMGLILLAAGVLIFTRGKLAYRASFP